MISKDYIKELIEKELAGSSLFLVEVKSSPLNQVEILIDGDKGVTIDDCAKISRSMDKALDRDKEDFDLKVSSPGIEYPLTSLRHYQSKIGKHVQVITKEDRTLKGKLLKVNENGLVLETETKKEKHQQEVDLENIKQAHCIIHF